MECEKKRSFSGNLQNSAPSYYDYDYDYELLQRVLLLVYHCTYRHA